jgi:hypothetical protein
LVGLDVLAGLEKKQLGISIRSVKRRNNKVPISEGKVITALPFLILALHIGVYLLG